VSSSAVEQTYTIREAAALTGLPASTLRYYETIGVIAPITRGESSKHRLYTADDLDLLTWVACLNGTGMSVSDMKKYVTNRDAGPATAGAQVALLTAQRDRLADEAARLVVRQQYVQIKIDYWLAIDAGDTDRAALLASEARSLTDQLKPAKA